MCSNERVEWVEDGESYAVAFHAGDFEPFLYFLVGCQFLISCFFVELAGAGAHFGCGLQRTEAG